MKEFNSRSKTIQFKIDDVEYKTKSRVPAGSIIDVDTDELTKAQQAMAMLKGILREESYNTFFERMHTEDEDKAIDLETFNEVTKWLVEELSSRPLQKS